MGKRESGHELTPAEHALAPDLKISCQHEDGGIDHVAQPPDIDRGHRRAATGSGFEQVQHVATGLGECGLDLSEPKPARSTPPGT